MKSREKLTKTDKNIIVYIYKRAQYMLRLFSR